MTAWVKALDGSCKLFTSHRRLLLPFALGAIVELFFLTLVWLAPQTPLSFFFAPPISYFSGSRVMHYPWHLWYLFHIMQNIHAASVIFVGAYMSGIACVMVRQIHENQPLSFRDALNSRQAKYARLLLIWLGTLLLTMPVMRLVRTVLVHVAAPPLALFAVQLALGVLLQALFVYPIPVAVFENVSWIKAFGRGLRETCRYPLSTLAVVIVPSLLLVAFSWSVNDARVSQWMLALIPEIALGCSASRLIMVTLMDAILTVGIAHLWWYHRQVPLKA